ncbi:MAG: DUF2231 domain-containing protein [Actinomycetota bacterium]|nr:DUF2231 domain-containing protein [Actinomycetota bacterium]
MGITNEYDAGPATPALVRWTRSLESSSALDRPVRFLQPIANALTANPVRRDALRGMWLGHALHPLLTDMPLGFWTSTIVLDLLGGRQARPAAARLLTLGVLSAIPAVVTGYAEWAATGQREKRVGAVHAASNATALALFASSLAARKADRHSRGVFLALAGSTAASVGGYLGGHLTSARKVSSRHPVFEQD